MKVYVLSSTYKSVKTVTGYLSLIWSERFGEIGDVQITFPYKEAYTGQYQKGMMLKNSESPEPMIIETAMTVKDSSGKTVFQVKARDLTSWLETRVSTNYGALGALTSGFAYNVLNRALSGVDAFSDLGIRNVATDTVTDDFEALAGELYSDVSSLLKDVNVGMRVVLRDASPQLLLELYSGQQQPVVFRDRNGTLINSKFITSNKKHRNVAIVRYRTDPKVADKTDTLEIYGNGGNPSKSGTARRAIAVDASNLNPNDYPGDRFIRVLRRMGKRALISQRMIQATDGEIPPYAPFQYRRDYFLGDVVKLQGDNGVKTPVRITEYIWSIDETGLRSYPTMSNETFDES